MTNDAPDTNPPEKPPFTWAKLLAGWADSAIRYLLIALISAAVIATKWAIAAEARISAVEATVADLGGRSSALGEVKLNLAVAQATLMTQAQTQVRIENLVLQLIPRPAAEIRDEKKP